jgi:hypothetical protein
LIASDCGERLKVETSSAKVRTTSVIKLLRFIRESPFQIASSSEDSPVKIRLICEALKSVWERKAFSARLVIGSVKEGTSRHSLRCAEVVFCASAGKVAELRALLLPAQSIFSDG